MKRLIANIKRHGLALLVLPLGIGCGNAWAAVNGIPGPNFALTARAGLVSTGDGQSLLMWGYANGVYAQYPGPVLIVNQGANVTVSLTNELPVTTSIVFPGQSGVTPSGGTPGLLTAEAAPGGTVSYSFVASNAGTYMYHSGTHMGLQLEMGLVGAIVVRPATPNRAYEHPATAYDREYLLVHTEMDKRFHELVNQMTASGTVNDATVASIDMTDHHPTLWFINGRNAPDSLFPDNVPWLPYQSLGSMVRALPGENILLRVIGAGRDLHPFHTHGNNFDLIAVDGRLLASAAGAGPDLARSDYTLKVVPGETYDALFRWTGKDLGWDIYGTVAQNPHACTDGNADGFDDTTYEYCPDHDKPLPVVLPEQQFLTFGGFWSGSPYMGVFGNLPPGDGGLNPNAGFTFMWHSHTELELTNDDIFPGGLMTMLVIEPPGTTIE